MESLAYAERMGSFLLPSEWRQAIHRCRMRPFIYLLAASSALALEIRVAPDGPVSSLAAARDAVRAAREKGDSSPARVVVADGLYSHTEAVVFEPRDGGVTYEAAPGARPVFSGGKKIGGWKKDGALWTTKTDLQFDALWINDQRAQREPQALFQFGRLRKGAQIEIRGELFGG